MVQTTTKFRFHFDDKQMLFEETYPQELSAIFPIEEFNAIIRKLNYELNLPIQQTSSSLRKWTTGTGIACCFVVGIFVVPVVWYKASRNEREMQEYWTRLREYLTEINRRGLIRRGLEWKVVEDRAKIKGHDCVNKVYCMRLDLLWRQGIVKSKKVLEREARLRGATSNTSTTTNTDTSTSENSVNGVVAPKRSSLRKSRPPLNIETVAEVSEAEELGQSEQPITQEAEKQAVSPEAENNLLMSDDEPPAESPLDKPEESYEQPTAELALDKPAVQEDKALPTASTNNFLDLSE